MEVDRAMWFVMAESVCESNIYFFFMDFRLPLFQIVRTVDTVLPTPRIQPVERFVDRRDRINAFISFLSHSLYPGATPRSFPSVLIRKAIGCARTP